MKARSDIAIVNINDYTKLCSPALKNSRGMLTAFSDSKLTALGYFKIPIMINDNKFTINACIVENFSVSVAVIHSKVFWHKVKFI